MCKQIKSIISVLMAGVMTIGLLAGCGEQNDQGNNGNGEKSSKTAYVRYYSAGYGSAWLEALAEKFNEIYADEGYKVKLDIQPGTNFSAANEELKLGAERNDVDMYFTNRVGVANVLEFSENVMHGKGPLLEPLEDIFNAPAIGADKQEEDKTIAERMFAGAENSMYLNSPGSEWDGQMFCLPYNVGCNGIIMNPTVLEKYNLEIPKTTDELLNVVKTIQEKGSADGVYPYAWAGNNASSYWFSLWYIYFAQYSGAKAFEDFIATMPESGDIVNDGWQVYEDKGILESLKAMEQLMKLDYSADGSVNATHTEAQHRLLVGEAAFMVNGDWLLNEMSGEYYEEASNCLMIKTPVLSVIGTECGISDAQLSQAIAMIDEGKTNEEVMAQISGVTAEGAERIRQARQVYAAGLSGYQVIIPGYADAKEVSKLFLKFMYSEDGCQIMRETSYMVLPVQCESYETQANTAFVKSVLEFAGYGTGVPVAPNTSLSPVRAASGMLMLNNNAYAEPHTFKAMMLYEDITAQYIYDTEREFMKEKWASYIMYSGLN